MHFITNAGGATHVVTEDEFNSLTATAGYRAATDEEIAAWKSRHLPKAPDGNAVETVLPATGGEDTCLAASSGGTLPSVSNSPQQSSTGDFDATNSHTPTRKPDPDAAPKSQKRARKGSQRDSV